MAKPKIKVNPKDFLLKKGEWLLLGAAGLGLAILLLMGVSTGTGAEDPDKLSKDMTEKASRIQQQAATGTEEPTPIPPWVALTRPGGEIPADKFAVKGPLFDPVTRPDTRRENPMVYGIEDYQIDLVRGPMKGYDIVVGSDGRAMIAVRITKEKGQFDPAKVQKAISELKKQTPKGRRGQPNRPAPAPQPPMVAGQPPGPPGPPGPGGAVRPPNAGGEGPGGYGQGAYNADAQRTETTIEYIPLESLDKAYADGKTAAMTVHPLRMVVVNATFPYRKELEEIKRALRLRDLASAQQYGPHFGKLVEEKDENGFLTLVEKVPSFELQRRVTQKLPNGQEVVIEDWPAGPNDTYDIRAAYDNKILSRSLADHVEEGYIPYFLRYDEGLAMPLPELASETGKAAAYPRVTIPSILETERKLGKRPPVKGSDLLERLQKGSGGGRYGPRGGDTANGLLGQGASQAPSRGPGVAGPGPMPVRPPGGGEGGRPPGPGGPFGGQLGNEPPAVDIDHWLVRFVDADVKPGFTYQYRIRLNMQNPNLLEPNMVANAALVGPGYEILRSKWTELPTPITVPAESFVFAFDPKRYDTEVTRMFGTAGTGPSGTTHARTDLLNLLKLRDAKIKPGIDGRGGELYQKQAVVEVQSWLEQVQTERGGRREPVGAWVSAEIPASRGEYIGRKQYVRLPLWSSVAQGYVLRASPDLIFPTKKKEKVQEQPPGWLVDFTSQDILVDFEGGVTRTMMPTTDRKTIEEDAATELLIAEPDGRGGTVLRVRNSVVDMADRARDARDKSWEAWLKDVEARKVDTATGQPGDNNPFAPKRP